jgi:hypothetical protein
MNGGGLGFTFLNVFSNPLEFFNCALEQQIVAPRKTPMSRRRRNFLIIFHMRLHSLPILHG